MVKKRFALSVLALLALVLAACGGQDANTAQDAPPQAMPQGGQSMAQEPLALPTSQRSPAFDTQSSDAGRVVVDVTPLTLSGDAWEFDVALNTHSVNLGFDMTEVSALRCDQGQEYTPTAWDGSDPGGHHRSGVLKFAALDHTTSFVEIVIRDVAGEPERVLHWEVPAAESSLDSTDAQVAASQSAPIAEEGPAHLVLSNQEFNFGDVVMSKGGVSKIVDITNTGPGILRIEGVEPT